MRVVLDTNVLVSGVFFGGPPRRILEAWRDERVELVACLEILEEYQEVGRRLSGRFPGVSLEPFFSLLLTHLVLVARQGEPEAVVGDADDDKFFACAVAAGARTLVSGDKAVLAASGYRGVEVLKPRTFVDRHL